MCKKKFTTRFGALLIGVIIGATLAYVGLAGAPQQVSATPQEYQLDIARGVGALMQSQCFNSTDRCCEYAVEMVNSMPEDTRTAAHMQHITKGLQGLVEADCIVLTNGCLEFAFGLVQGPITRSAFTYPPPHEGE